MVNQVGVPDESASTHGGVDDIPEARRDGGLFTVSAPRPRRPWKFLAWAMGGLFLMLGLGLMMSSHTLQSEPSTAAPTSALSIDTPTSPPAVVTDGLLGHFPYAEAPTATLKAITRDGKIQLQQSAADRFISMAQAARQDQVILVPLSGFRSLEEQTALFFERKAEMGQRAVERASVSAPPGYSEHHTGYAIDIGDGTRSATDLELSFETTPAFQWLQANAPRFGFELSFPRNNPQGVSYEPWHWRFVGDRQSLETFYKSRQIRPVPVPSPHVP